jgi:hypothetical protein
LLVVKVWGAVMAAPGSSLGVVPAIHVFWRKEAVDSATSAISAGMTTQTAMVSPSRHVLLMLFEEGP